jgi:hypothetical protein
MSWISWQVWRILVSKTCVRDTSCGNQQWSTTLVYYYITSTHTLLPYLRWWVEGCLRVKHLVSERRRGDFVILPNNLHASYIHKEQCTQTMFGSVWQQCVLRHHMMLSHGACDSGHFKALPGYWYALYALWDVRDTLSERMLLGHLGLWWNS